MKIKQHKSGLWVTDDGRVIMPPCPKYPKFRFTFGSKNRGGYLEVQFRGKRYYVHRLVAEVHVINPNPGEYREIDHKDRNPQNNASSNLRWCDRKIQMANRKICENSLNKYGVRSCKDFNGYRRAYYARNPECSKRHLARCHVYRDRQRALGRRCRKCPDGSRHWLTDEEYEARFGQLRIF